MRSRFPMFRLSIPRLISCLVAWEALCAPAFAADAPQDPGMKEMRRQAAGRPRRILYNNDGNEPMGMEKFSVEEFLSKRTTRLAGTQVGTILYCTGPGFGLFMHGTKAGQLFTTRAGRYANNRVEEFLKAGTDPLKEIVKFGHQNGMEVFWSMRMNDTHDGAAKEYGPDLFKANRLKTQHPEWLLGSEANPPHHGKWSGINYEVPEVRELAFRIIEDVCQNHDVDGIEMDFFRHPTFFKYPGKNQPVTDAQRQMMTDLMRRVRAMADAEGKKRGRPILIAMKVPDSVEYCRTIGLDLEQWLAGDLLDLLVTTSYFRLNEWDYSVALGHKYGVKVYPSLDEPRIEDKEGQKLRMSANAYRGRAAEVWAAGADGVYLYNFFKKDSPYEVLKEAGDPALLAKTDRFFFASSLGRAHVAGGGFPHGSFQKIEILNPADPRKIAPGKSAEARLNLPVDISANPSPTLQLRLRFATDVPPDAVKVAINGTALSNPEADRQWLDFDLPASAVRSGQNVVQATLSESQKESIVWTDLLVHVRTQP